MLTTVADDFGICEDVDVTIVKMLQSVPTSRASLLLMSSNPRHSAIRAVRMARNNSVLDRVDLHLNLSDGRPLSVSKRESWGITNLYGDSMMGKKKFWKFHPAEVIIQR